MRWKSLKFFELECKWRTYFAFVPTYLDDVKEWCWLEKYQSVPEHHEDMFATTWRRQMGAVGFKQEWN